MEYFDEHYYGIENDGLPSFCADLAMSYTQAGILYIVRARLSHNWIYSSVLPHFISQTLVVLSAGQVALTLFIPKPYSKIEAKENSQSEPIQNFE